jgi:hypothetical protein
MRSHLAVTRFGPPELALSAVLALTWGSSFLFIAIAIKYVDPAIVPFGRSLLGAFTLAFFPGARAGIPWKHWPRIALLGLVWMALPFWLFPLAEQSVTSGVAGMINGGLLGARTARCHHLDTPCCDSRNQQLHFCVVCSCLHRRAWHRGYRHGVRRVWHAARANWHHPSNDPHLLHTNRRIGARCCVQLREHCAVVGAGYVHCDCFGVDDQQARRSRCDAQRMTAGRTSSCLQFLNLWF